MGAEAFRIRARLAAFDAVLRPAPGVKISAFIKGDSWGEDEKPGAAVGNHIGRQKQTLAPCSSPFFCFARVRGTGPITAGRHMFSKRADGAIIVEGRGREVQSRGIRGSRRKVDV